MYVYFPLLFSFRFVLTIEDYSRNVLNIQETSSDSIARTFTELVFENIPKFIERRAHRLGGWYAITPVDSCELGICGGLEL